jgi:type I restriction enzyme S subunit
MSHPAYPAYKPSGVEWLGDVPEHWVAKRVSFIFIKANAGEVIDKSYWGEGNELLFTCDRNPMPSDFPVFPKEKRTSERDLLLTRNGTPYVHKPPAHAIYSNVVQRIRLKDGIDRDFCGHTLGAACLSLRGYGVSIESLNFGMWKSLRVALPPLEEQRAIAGFLDRETERIDALIEKKQRQIELLQEKRSALISHAVTKGLDPNAPTKPSGIPWLDDIPQHWDVPPLYARYSVELGKMLDAKRITGDQLLPYLRNVDVQWDQVNIEDLPEMDITPSEYARFTLRDGDLLVCEGGELGRTAIWRGEVSACAFQKAIHRLRPRSPRDVSRFLYYVMRAATSSGIFLAYGNPNTIPHLTAEKLRVHRFGFPPLDEQRAIAAFLDRETERIDALAQKIEGSIEKLREYRTALISAAVTGKIDVREEG